MPIRQEDEARVLYMLAEEIKKAMQGAEYEELPDTAESYDFQVSGHYR